MNAADFHVLLLPARKNAKGQEIAPFLRERNRRRPKSDNLAGVRGAN
jgi:hypothetical protein